MNSVFGGGGGAGGADDETKRLSWVWNATPKKVNHVFFLILDDATIDIGTVGCGRFVEPFVVVEEPVKGRI